MTKYRIVKKRGYNILYFVEKRFLFWWVDTYCGSLEDVKTHIQELKSKSFLPKKMVLEEHII